MYQNIKKQEKYWDSSVATFDSIYTHKKSKVANYLDKKLRWDMFERFNYTFKNSEPIKDKNVLDVGCGTGIYCFEFNSRGAKYVTGIDISENMISYCNSKAKELNLTSKCEFLKADPFSFEPNLKYDIVIGIGLFDYISNANIVIKRFTEVSTGKMIMTFPRKSTLRSFIRKIRLFLLNCDVYFYTEEQIRNILSENNLQLYNIEIIGQLFCVTAEKK